MNMVTPAMAVAPVAPGPSYTQPLAESDMLSDDTSTIDVPMTTANADRVAQLLDDEASVRDDADLSIFCAMVWWDCFDASDEVRTRLRSSIKHPAAARLALAYALNSGLPADLVWACDLIAKVADPFTRSGLQIIAAETWWFRHNDTKAALSVAIGHSAAISDTLLIASGNREGLLTLASTRSNDPEASPESLADLLGELQDDNGSQAPHRDIIAIGLTALRAQRWSLSDDTNSQASASQAKIPNEENPQAPRWLHLSEIVIDSALVAGSAEQLHEALTLREELLRRCRDGIADALATGLVKTAGTVFGASLPTDQGAATAALLEAIANLATLSKDKYASTHLTGANLARQFARIAAARSTQSEALLTMHRELAAAPSAAGTVAAHARRAADLYNAVAKRAADNNARIKARHQIISYLEIADTHMPVAGISQLRVRTACVRANRHDLTMLEGMGGHQARWAAMLTESAQGDASGAIARWRPLCDDASTSTGFELDQVARLQRARIDRAGLAKAYQALHGSEADPRCQQVWQFAYAMVSLIRGATQDAETALDTLRTFVQPNGTGADLLAIDIAQTAVLRGQERWFELEQLLGQLTTSVQSPRARASLARERAMLLADSLDRASDAIVILEEMLAANPGDAETMVALAQLSEQGNGFERAAQLRRRAISVAPEAATKSKLLVELAMVEQRRGDVAAAQTALERARSLDPHDPAVLGALAQLQIKTGATTDAIAMLQTELTVSELSDGGHRIELQTHLARAFAAQDPASQATLQAWLDVLQSTPDCSEALIAIEAPAQQLAQWTTLVQAFRRAPRTTHNLNVLALALEKTEDWHELIEVKMLQVGHSSEPSQRAHLAAEAADIYADQLGDRGNAARLLLQAQSIAPDPTRQNQIIDLLESSENWAELAGALERELPTIPAADRDRQVSLLRRLGELRSEKLSRYAEAAVAYESALELDPEDELTLLALEQLYLQLGRERELARILETRAELANVPIERGALFAQVGALRASRNDIEGSLAGFLASIAADPSNRDVFTALERICYKHQRWTSAMQLYETTIAHVKAGNPRAYRLGDLYARQGQIQLQFLNDANGAIESYSQAVIVDSSPENATKALESIAAKRRDFALLVTAYERRADATTDAARKVDALRTAAHYAQLVNDPGVLVRIQRQLLTHDPSDREAALTLERYYEEHHDPTGLVEVLRSRLASADDQVEIAQLLRRIAQVSEEGARDVTAAVDAYQKLLEMQPDHREALDALARIFESTEKWHEFIEITRRQIRVTTDRTAKALMYFRCGSVTEAKFGREDDAIRYYDQAVKASAACLPAVHGLRDIYLRRKDWPRVIESLELEVKLWQDDKERAGVFAQIGKIYDERLADPERAMHYYESAITVDAECLPANQALFEHLVAIADWEKAKPLAAKLGQRLAREGDPQARSEFYRKRGLVAQMTGDSAAAADSFITSLEINPNNLATLDQLGVLARSHRDAFDFESTYRELEKIYRKREDAGPLLARVMIGQAAIFERDGDLDRALAMYEAATELAPSDFVVLGSLINFHVEMRQWDHGVFAIERFVANPATRAADRISALLRQAEIHAEGQMNSQRAIAVLREVIKLDLEHGEAHYRLAQEYYLLSRLPEATASIDRLIAISTAPGKELSPTALARYYYYKGRIADAAGEHRAAAPQYRRAIEYDPGYAPPALVLARRASDAGDQRQAETLLIDAAHAAMASGGTRAAVPLQRGLARILLASGDRPAAIDAYRGILNVEPDNAGDRVTLAEIYAVTDLSKAIAELKKVIERDLHHAPAYRLLASFYNRAGDTIRAGRVLSALTLLGFSEEADRSTAQQLRNSRAPAIVRQALSADARGQYLLMPASKSIVGQVFDALAEPIATRFATAAVGGHLVALRMQDEFQLSPTLTELCATMAVAPEVFIGDRVPGMMAAIAFPRPMLVLDRSIANETPEVQRFILGYGLEAIRGGYAFLLTLGARQRRELTALLKSILSAPESRSTAAVELIAGLPSSAKKFIEDNHQHVRDGDVAMWLDGALAVAKRGGLLACDDYAAAIWAVARLAGETPTSHDETIALGAVLGGPDLLRFYISDDYQRLRDFLAAAP